MGGLDLVEGDGELDDDDMPPPVRGFEEDQPIEMTAEQRAYQESPARLPVGPAPAGRSKALGQPMPPRQSFSPFATTAAAPVVRGPHDPRIVQSSTFAELTVAPTTLRDIDRLWDWIRTDADGGQQFLGQHFSHSQQLHTLVQRLIELEQPGLAVFRSLLWETRHFGFLMLSPILADEQTALCHVYLEAQARGGFDGLIDSLVSIAEQLVPNTHLAFYSPDAPSEQRYTKVLGQLGFKKHAMFIR